MKRTTVKVIPWILGVGLVALCPGMVLSQDLPTLEQALIKRAPKVIAHLQSKQYQNVGVLKFLVVKDGKKFSDNVGSMNLLLARQVETALIVMNDPKQPVGIVDNASAVAAKTAGANHLTREGRLKLFEPRYPLAWGKATVMVDAFVTGVADVSADLGKVTLGLLVFDARDNKLEPMGNDLVAALRPNQLVDLGESFMVRGLFDGGTVEVKNPVTPTHLIHQAVKVREQKEKHPLQETVAPISLGILYDGKEVKPQYRDGKAYIPEPHEGQKVELVLKSVAKKGRFAVVLKVNGENTIERERLPDLHCHKWVLEAGEGPYSIKGYQVGDNTALAFRVAGVAESQEREINYGADVGTITMTVFREGKAAKPGKDLLDYDKAYEGIVEKVQRPKEPANNYHALKAQLLADANRGLIVEGHPIESVTRTVTFVPDPAPVMCVTVVYYKRY